MCTSEHALINVTYVICTYLLIHQKETILSRLSNFCITLRIPMEGFCNKNESIFKMFDWKRANEEELSVIFPLAKFEIKQYVIRMYV